MTTSFRRWRLPGAALVFSALAAAAAAGPAATLPGLQRDGSVLLPNQWSLRPAVDSTLYSTSSMLRTIELILGLQPMSQFDAAAVPLWAAFSDKADLAPYTERPAQVDLDARNTRVAWGSRESQKMDFSAADKADDIVLNEIVWRSVRGADSPMPAPVRAAFFKAHPKKDDDD